MILTPNAIAAIIQRKKRELPTDDRFERVKATAWNHRAESSPGYFPSTRATFHSFSSTFRPFFFCFVSLMMIMQAIKTPMRNRHLLRMRIRSETGLQQHKYIYLFLWSLFFSCQVPGFHRSPFCHIRPRSRRDSPPRVYFCSGTARRGFCARLVKIHSRQTWVQKTWLMIGTWSYLREAPSTIRYSISIYVTGGINPKHVALLQFVSR